MSNKVLKAISLFLFVFLMNAKESKSADNNDLKLRMGVELEKDLNKKLSIHLAPEIRLVSKQELEEVFIETGLTYDLFKFMKVGGYYRAYFSESDVITSRFALDVKPDWKFEDLKIQYRFRFTNYTDFDLETTDKSNYIRNRLKLDYKFSKLDLTPFAATELFYHGGNKEFNKIRYIGGLEIELNKDTDVSVYYMRQKKITGKKGFDNFAGLSFKISLD